MMLAQFQELYRKQKKMKYFYCIAIIVLISFVSSQQLSDDYDTFLLSFPRFFSKNSAEYQTRKNIFKQNVKFYNSINNNPESTFKVRISNTSDNTIAQVKDQRGIKTIGKNLRNTVHSTKTQSFFVGDIELPTSVNYKAQNKVTEVRNQGMCGSCWAFAAVAYYESQLMIRGFRYNLSQQASLQCTWRYALNNQKNDCGGGYFDDALGFLAKVGSVLRDKYPYVAQTTLVDFPNTPGICTETERIFIGKGNVDGYFGLTISQIKSLLVNHGPLMLGIASSSNGFLNYASGVYSGCSAEDQIDHAVLLIGYDGNENWIIKNSWGTSWGENGFIRLSMANDCRMTQQVYRLIFLQPQLSNPSATFSPITMMNMLSSDLGECYHLLSLAILLVFVFIQ